MRSQGADRSAAPERWALAALALAVVAVLAVLVVPVYEAGRGPSQTLVAHEGAWVLLVACAPVVLIAGALLVPRAARHRALWVAAVALGAFAFVAGFTIGAFYWPAVVLLLVAVAKGRSTPSRRRAPCWPGGTAPGQKLFGESRGRCRRRLSPGARRPGR